jgi:DNA polymerase III subunit epsilon
MSDQTTRDNLLHTPLSAVPFVLLDVESTGLSVAAGDRVCEIALARRRGGVVEDRWETLINPGRPISAAAYAVNQIDATMLQEAPPFAEIAESLVRRLDGAVLVGHNLPFDLEFIDSELTRLGRPPLLNPRVDTLGLARCFLRHERYSLQALATELGFEQPSHRAMSDVLSLGSLFDHLLACLQGLGVTTLGDLMRAQRGLLPGQPEPEVHPLLVEALRTGSRLRIAYRTGGGDPIYRDVLPFELQLVHGMPRLLAFCYLRSGHRTFYLDRIADYALPGQDEPSTVEASGPIIVLSELRG